MGEVIAKPLPHNDELERNVLGAVLADSPQQAELLATLEIDDFFNLGHRLIFAVLQKLASEGEKPDLLRVCDRLQSAGRNANVVGSPYVASLLSDTVLRSNMVTAAHRLREFNVLRRLIHLCEAVKAAAFDRPERPANLVDRVIDQFSELARGLDNGSNDGFSHFDAAARAFDELEAAGPKIFTSVEKLDKVTGGFRAGELVILAAETGCGKTLFAQQIRRRACRDGFHSIFCSGEMFASNLKRRELAIAAGVPPLKMRHEDRITSKERQSLSEAAQGECKYCRILDGELEISRIRRSARKMKRLGGLDLVVIDYDELVGAPGESELEQQTALVRSAKLIGVELRCAVILISQFRKSASGDCAYEPTLARIFGSGSKTKHASFVIAIDRPYIRDLRGDPEQAQIYILKGRDSETGRIRAAFNISKLRFDDHLEVGPAVLERI
jgi:replicative DNA helicase